MLNSREKTVMGLVYEMSADKGTSLVKPIDILKKIPYRIEFTPHDLETIMKTLTLDDYFEMVVGDRGGEPVYCITLHDKGFAFKRSVTVLKRTIGFKIALAVGSAIVTFTVGMILKAIF